MVYSKIVGNAPNAVTSILYGYTIIDRNSAATSTATLDECQIYTNGSQTVKVKIFRDDGTNYLFIDEESISCISGENFYDIDMNITSGDYIGYYQSASPGVTCNTISGSYSRKVGDITTNSLKSSWSDYTGTHSIGAGRGRNRYVKTAGDDAKDGLSWTNAWKTINKAATTLIDSEVARIGFGTYDAEPAGNKIAPQNVVAGIGKEGIWYMPETAETGGGTGTVIVEIN